MQTSGRKKSSPRESIVVLNVDIEQQGISTPRRIFWPSDWMAWEQSLEAFAFRRGSSHEKAFGLKQRFIHESGSYAEMETGTTALAFVDEKFAQASHSFRPNSPSTESPGIEICLVTDHVEQQFNRAVQAGAIPIVKPAQKPWGQLVSYVKDNNGCLVEICSPIGG